MVSALHDSAPDLRRFTAAPVVTSVPTSAFVIYLKLKVPAMGFALFWVARTQTTVMGENRLMHLVVLVEFAMPSAAVRTCA